MRTFPMVRQMLNPRHSRTTIYLRSVMLLSMLIAAGCSVSRPLIRGDERIIFFGDSITEQGVKPGGYVTLIADSLHKIYTGHTIHVIGAGVSGNKVGDLQKRMQHDVLDKNPTIVVMYIGINDVWHYSLPNLTGTSKDKFEAGLEQIIHTLQEHGARVVLCTPSVIGEKNDHTNPQDALLDEYAAVSRRVASETGSSLCDLRQAFVEYLKIHNPKNEEKGILTVDRVHLNDAGNRFVATQILSILEH